MPQLPLNSAHLALHTMTQVQVVLEPALVAQTLNETQMLGRLQRVSWQGLPIWLDVAHNAAAARWVVERLQPLSPQWSIILGMRQDKDVAAVVDSLSVMDSHWIVLDLSDSVQGLSSTELIQRTELKTARVAASVPEALAIAQRLGHPTLICGSFLTIAAALRTLQPQDDHE
jgi:dihydrofolate synthase/folylpolyglutamate synthase